MPENPHNPVASVLDADLSGFEPAPRVNRQLYENSGMEATTSATQYRESEDALFETRRPNLVVLNEKPEHRLCIWLKVQGFSNREISERTGYTQPWLSQLFRQPWARQRIVSELQKAGKDSLQEILKASAEDSVYTLIELRDTAENESVRKSAASDLLDRFLGKPTQKIEQTSKQMPTTIEALDAELHKLKLMEKEILGGSTN
jgi:lambda repressor-like predicted transcriptional regulator